MQARRIEGDLWDFGTVVAPTGQDRLCLCYVGEDALDFHELVWERNLDGKWTRHRTLDPRMFLCASESSWIAELHSFDSINGTAIVRVGETAKRDEFGMSNVEYTWRSVSLLRPNEPEVLQKCKVPFEPYAG